MLLKLITRLKRIQRWLIDENNNSFIKYADQGKLKTRMSEIIHTNYASDSSSSRSNKSMNSINSNSITQSAKVIDAQYHALWQVLDTQIINNKSNFFDFSAYLSVLKAMSFLSESLLTTKEEELLTKSWHAISFFHNSNIITSSQNIKTFLSGVIGLDKIWMYKSSKVRFKMLDQNYIFK